jgi:ribosomal protein L37AE/L43A
MGLTANNLRGILVAAALMQPVSAIYAEFVSITPHVACSSVAPIVIAKPSIGYPDVMPISVVRTEIASVKPAGKEPAEADTGSPQDRVSLPCPSPSPIGVRYGPGRRREIKADYERKRPRDQTAALQKEAATRVEIQIWRLGVSKSGGAFLSAFVTNRNDFALQQITLRCEFTTAKGSRVHLYKLADVIEPLSLGPATINYTDHYLGAAPQDAVEADCIPDDVVAWSPGEDIQSRR